MNKLLFFLLSIVLIVFISGCVFPVQKAQVGYGSTELATEDLKVSVESALSEVQAGKSTNLYFVAENRQPFDIENIKVNVYDACLFSGDKEQSFKLEPNKTKEWKWKYMAGDTTLPIDCNIKFKTEYAGSIIKIQTIAVLREDEYLQETRTGDIGKIRVQSSSTANPLKISLSFSETQPFADGLEVYMRLNYQYSGEGIIDKLEAGSVSIVFPPNVEVASCDDYSNGALNKDLVFINKKAEDSVCKLRAKASQPIDSKTLTLTAKYKYTSDNKITIKVKPK